MNWKNIFRSEHVILIVDLLYLLLLVLIPSPNGSVIPEVINVLLASVLAAVIAMNGVRKPATASLLRMVTGLINVGVGVIALPFEIDLVRIAIMFMLGAEFIGITIVSRGGSTGGTSGSTLRPGPEPEPEPEPEPRPM